jgi:hypothetical protein
MTVRKPSNEKATHRLTLKKDTLKDLSLRDSSPVRGGAPPEARTNTYCRTCSCRYAPC